jgi:hypothetical protein
LRDIEVGKDELKKEIFLKNKSGIEYWKNHNKWALNYSKELKEHLKELKKHIK